MSGQPFWQFPETRVLQPLSLRHTIDLDAQHRHALGLPLGGFVAANSVSPDDSSASVVLTNHEASPAAGSVARALAALMLPGAASAADSEASPSPAVRARTLGACP